MLQNIGWVEILIIGAVLLVLFGGKKLPEFVRGLGESAKELKKAKKESNKSVKETLE